MARYEIHASVPVCIVVDDSDPTPVQKVVVSDESLELHTLTRHEVTTPDDEDVDTETATRIIKLASDSQDWPSWQIGN